MGISSTSYTLCGVDPLPVWVLRTRELGSSAPIRVVQVDRESRVLVSVHAKRAGLVNLGEYLVEWSSPAHVCHENRLREAPDWCCPRDEIGDVLSELHVKARFRIFAYASLFVINESEYVRPGLGDFNEINLAVRKSAEASFELFGFGFAEPAVSVDDHSFYGLARLSRMLLDAPFQRVSLMPRAICTRAFRQIPILILLQISSLNWEQSIGPALLMVQSPPTNCIPRLKPRIYPALLRLLVSPSRYWHFPGGLDLQATLSSRTQPSLSLNLPLSLFSQHPLFDWRLPTPSFQPTFVLAPHLFRSLTKSFTKTILPSGLVILCLMTTFIFQFLEAAVNS